MSLIYCPECGTEISNAAIACPNCGRPIHGAPSIERKVVIAERLREGDGFPTWVFIPLGILGVGLLFFLFAVIGRNNEEETNTRVNVNMDSERRQTSGSTTYAREQQIQSAPPLAGSQPVSIPGSQTSVKEVPTTGTVMIEAKVVTGSRSQQTVRGQRFYLLDKDVESILSEAGLEPIVGQSLVNSYGLAVLYPDRYAEFNRNALRAIKPHIKYAGLTDASGKAQLGGVEPNSYYIFGIAKVGNGFAVWSSAVSVLAGENILNLSPQTINEIQDTAS